MPRSHEKSGERTCAMCLSLLVIEPTGLHVVKRPKQPRRYRTLNIGDTRPAPLPMSTTRPRAYLKDARSDEGQFRNGAKSIRARPPEPLIHRHAGYIRNCAATRPIQ